MKTCENCKNWIPMKEHEGKCVLYGLKHCAWTPSEATCDEWVSDESEVEDKTDLISRADAIKKLNRTGRDYGLSFSDIEGAEHIIRNLPPISKCEEELDAFSYEIGHMDGRKRGYEEGLKRASERCGEWEFSTAVPLRGGAYAAGYVCSNCGDNYVHVDGMNYCPNCGADMKTR